MTYIKLYGLQRSGTNVIKGLLEINFRDVIVLQSILGSKHKPFDRESILSWQPSELDSRYLTMSADDVEAAKESFRRDEMCAVLSIKSPYSWLVSYYRLRKEKNPQFTDWCPAYIRKTLPLWIRMNASWLRDLQKEFGDRLVVNFYDETGIDATTLLEELESHFCLIRRGALVSSLPRATVRGNDSHFGEKLMSEKKFDYEYYIGKQYRRRYTDRQKEIVDNMLREAPQLLRPYIVW